jgi:hypothetical protein
MTAEQGVEHRTTPYSGFDMFIYRATQDKQGVRRWYATTSGVKKDLYGERMSVELFDDFIARIDSGEEAPPPFTSNQWNGGNPYLGIAHYLDLDGDGIVGDTEKVWRDGDVLKAKGTFKDSPLGDAVFKAIQEDRAVKRADQERVRISIAFVDWAHDHDQRPFVRESLQDACMLCEAGVGEKVYKAGHLVHFANTRRPAYVETEIVALEEKSMGKSKRYDDAESIVGKELADEIESKSKTLIGRSDDEGDVAAGVIVVKDESAGQEAEAEVERDLGGAQSLDDAETYLTEKAASGPVLLNQWEILAGVLGNIVDDEQKALAIRDQLGEFQKTLDVQTAQAVLDVQRALGGVEVAKETEEKVERQVPPQFRKDEKEEEEPKRRPAEEGEEEEEEEKEAEEKAAPVHPLDQFFATMRERFDEAVATPGDLSMKVGIIQESFTQLGEGASQLISEAAASAPVDASQINRMVESAVETAVTPLMAELVAMRADIQAGSAVSKSESLVPNRRAMRMPVSDPSSSSVVKSAPVVGPTDDNPTPKLRDIIRRNTVEFEQRRGG